MTQPNIFSCVFWLFKPVLLDSRYPLHSTLNDVIFGSTSNISETPP